MPVLWNTKYTSSTDSPAYQRSIGSAEVEGGVHERVGLGVLFSRHVREVDALVLGEERLGALEVRLQVRLLHAVAALELTHEQLGVGPDPDATGGELACGLQRRDQRPVLGDVVRRDADALAHGRELRGWVGGRIENNGADRGRARVAARPAVAVDDQLAPRRHGTRMQPQLS